MRRLIAIALLVLAVGLLAVAVATPSSAREAWLERGPEIAERFAEDELLQIIKNDMAKAGSGRFGVAVKHLPTGRTVYWNAERSYRSASLYKLLVLYEAFRQQRAGAISLDDRMVITQAIANVNGGYSPVPIGSSLSIRRALELMITVSDNASAVALRQRLGVDAINTSIRHRLGLTETVIAYDSKTSPRDMLRYFDGLARLSYLDVDAGKEMTRLLLNQQRNDRIPANLPSWVWVAHKTGELDGVQNDAGIVYTPAGPVIIAFVGDGAASLSALRRAEATLSADIYKFAVDGRFGPPTSAPFLYDPELEARIKGIVSVAGGKVAVAIGHLSTGQGTLVRPSSAWPLDTAFDPNRLADPRAVRERRAAAHVVCQGESECVAALAEPVSAEEFARRIERGELYEGGTLRFALARARESGGILATVPAEDVVAYLDSREGGTVREVALVRGSSGTYAIASSAPASAEAQLREIGAATHSYLSKCVWGARPDPKACSAG